MNSIHKLSFFFFFLKGKQACRTVFLSFHLDVFINLQLHSQGLEKMLGVGQLLLLELHLTLKPENTKSNNQRV